MRVLCALILATALTLAPHAVAGDQQQSFSVGVTTAPLCRVYYDEATKVLTESCNDPEGYMLLISYDPATVSDGTLYIGDDAIQLNSSGSAMVAVETPVRRVRSVTYEGNGTPIFHIGVVMGR